jgi:peptidoglycan/LPS O-acetylase OafA/YrhL
LRLFAFATAWIVTVCQSLDRLEANEQYYHMDWNATGVVAVVTLIFAVMLMVATGRTGALGRRNWLLIGSLTYPLYLLHQNIGYIVFNAGYPVINPHVLLWGTLILMLTAAFAVNRLVERRLPPRMKKRMDQAFDWLARRFTAWRERWPRPGWRTSPG